MKRAIAIVLLSFTVSLPFVYAQTGSEADIIDQGIDLTIVPDLPGPNASAEARLQSSTADLDRSVITWSINGKTLQSGLGQKVFSFSTGDVGTLTVVSATVKSPDGVFTKAVTLDDGSVDLLWQGEGYVPPFYEGRTLWGHQTRVTFFAVPHVRQSAFAYRWSVNGQVIGGSSGANKNTFVLTGSLMDLPQEVTVDIMSDPQTVVASASATLTSIDPVALVYEQNPILGFLFHKEVGDAYLMNDKEVTFAAFPYFFSPPSRLADTLAYAWTTNSGTAQHTDTVTYRAPDGGAGSASVGIEINHITQVLESASKNFLVQFGNQNGH